jgi:hypothetical protein
MADDDRVNATRHSARRIPLTDADHQRRRAAKAQHAEVTRRRRATAYSMHLAGASFRQIAAALNVSLRTAHQDFRRERDALAALEREPIVQRRDTLYQRLERMLAALMPKVLAGDVRAAEVAIKLSERQARLMGLDSPQLIAQRIQLQEVNAEWRPTGEEAVAIARVLAAMSPSEQALYWRLAKSELKSDGEDWTAAALDALRSMTDEELAVARKIAAARTAGQSRALPAVADAELLADDDDEPAVGERTH